MILYVDGSDIASLVLGEGEVVGPDWRLVRSKQITTGPEGFLAAIHDFLGYFLAEQKLAGIICAIGPGSPTALRASVTIVDSLGLVKGIPLYGVASGVTAGVLPQPSEVLLPKYTDFPRITTSTRDALRRQM